MAQMKLGCSLSDHEKQDGCYNCCETCNYAEHKCHGCGEDLRHDGREYGPDGKYHVDCLAEWTVEKDRVVKQADWSIRASSQ